MTSIFVFILASFILLVKGDIPVITSLNGGVMPGKSCRQMIVQFKTSGVNNSTFKMIMTPQDLPIDFLSKDCFYEKNILFGRCYVKREFLSQGEYHSVKILEFLKNGTNFTSKTFKFVTDFTIVYGPLHNVIATSMGENNSKVKLSWIQRWSQPCNKYTYEVDKIQCKTCSQMNNCSIDEVEGEKSVCLLTDDKSSSSCYLTISDLRTGTKYQFQLRYKLQYTNPYSNWSNIVNFMTRSPVPTICPIVSCRINKEKKAVVHWKLLKSFMGINFTSVKIGKSELSFPIVDVYKSIKTSMYETSISVRTEYSVALCSTGGCSKPTKRCRCTLTPTWKFSNKDNNKSELVVMWQVLIPISGILFFFFLYSVLWFCWNKRRSCRTAANSKDLIHPRVEVIAPYSSYNFGDQSNL